MAETRVEKVEELKRDKNVRRALEETSGPREPKKQVSQSSGRVSLVTCLILTLAGAAAYLLLRFNYISVPSQYAASIIRAVLGVTTIFFVLLVRQAIKAFLIAPLDNNAARYNLSRVINLLAGLTIFFIALSVLFANWYTAVLSLGLISLILGFALQTPITSFIGWIYVLVKQPYRVGDRIKIGEAKGDVIDVGYLDTTLWEFGGDLSTDHPSGRIIKFPNSKVLDSSVYNYSWSLFPYIWNDIKFQIAYQSDLEFVSKVLSETAAEEVGEDMMERIRVYRDLLAQTPVDELEVQERPVVVFRVSDNTWIEAIVRYLVEPRHAGPVKTRLIKKMLARLNAEPEKVMFPKDDSR